MVISQACSNPQGDYARSHNLTVPVEYDSRYHEERETGGNLGTPERTWSLWPDSQRPADHVSLSSNSNQSISVLLSPRRFGLIHRPRTTDGNIFKLSLNMHVALYMSERRIDMHFSDIGTVAEGILRASKGIVDTFQANLVDELGDRHHLLTSHDGEKVMYMSRVKDRACTEYTAIA